MASGVAVSDDCVSKFNELKLGHNYRYIIFKLNDNNTEIVVEKAAAPTAKWEDFVKDLPKEDCRYAAYDFEFSVEGGNREKIVFVLWSSDNAKTKSKMLYTSSKDALKKKLNLMGGDVQATDASEIDYNTVLERVKTFTK